MFLLKKITPKGSRTPAACSRNQWKASMITASPSAWVSCFPILNYLSLTKWKNAEYKIENVHLFYRDLDFSNVTRKNISALLLPVPTVGYCTPAKFQ